MKNKDKILISTIIPSYNRADTVGLTIDSILAQEADADMEIVIGDDCSTDNAREVLLQYQEKYPDIIRLIFHEQNVGLGANWAICVKACRGKYICNCDNDDYWHNPQKLQLQLDYMESHPDSNICVTNHRTLNRMTGEISEREVKIDHSNLQMQMYNGGYICNATVMYRADFLKTHLDLDTWIKRQFKLQDWPAWVILTAYTDIDVLPVSTATFGVETVSITRPASVDQLAKRLMREKDIHYYFEELFPDKFPFSEKEWNDFYAGQLVAMAYETNDFNSAHYYSKQHPRGVLWLKVFCARYRWSFLLLRWLREKKRRKK